MFTKEFELALIKLLNKHSIDNMTGTPDYMLAEYLVEHLQTLSRLNLGRDQWGCADLRNRKNAV